MYRAAPVQKKSAAKKKKKYVVQGIVGHRILAGVEEFNINWQGPYWHSWHTASELQNGTLIEDYIKKRAKKPFSKKGRGSRSKLRF